MPSKEIAFPDPQNPAFTVRRGEGDYNRAGAAGIEVVPGGDDINWAKVAAVLRYSIEIPDQIDEVLFFSKPIGYSAVQLWWGTPPSNLLVWSEFKIVRSGFGHPQTLFDGEVIHTVTNPDDNAKVPDIFIDGTDIAPLPSGRWYYYTILYRVGVRWIPVGTTECLVPIDYHHRDHMLGLMPPFYLQREDEDAYSYIHRWMSLIGYDLDYTRTLAEGVQNIYDPDSSPQVLLDAMGTQNLGFEKPASLGDVRYRAVLANNRNILFKRGTLDGLKIYMESVFKSKVTTTNGLNELLLVDDAEFMKGVGNWSPMPWRIGYELAQSDRGVNTAVTGVVPASDTFTTRGVTIEEFPPDTTDLNAAIWNEVPQEIATVSGIARVQASGGDQLAITCGSGQQEVITGVDSGGLTLDYDEHHLDPFYRGISVKAPMLLPDNTYQPRAYYLSFWARREPGNTTESDMVVYGFAQFDKEPGTQGFSDGFRAVNDHVPRPLITLGGFDGWQARDAWASTPYSWTTSPNYYQLWEKSDVPTTINTTDAPITLGTNFFSYTAGWATHIRWYHATNAPGPYIGNIWRATDSAKLVEVSLVPNGIGWQEQKLPFPVPITANQTYTVSYHCGHGGYGTKPGVLVQPNYQSSGPLGAVYDAPGSSRNGALATAADGATVTASRYPNRPTTPAGSAVFADVVFTTLVPNPDTYYAGLAGTWPAAKPSVSYINTVAHSGLNSDKWTHYVMSVVLNKDTRYIVPFIWFQRTPAGPNLMPAPITTPRYLTGVLVNESQAVGVLQVYQPDEFLKMLAQTDPTKHIIGEPGGSPTRTATNEPPYKVLGEQRR